LSRPLGSSNSFTADWNKKSFFSPDGYSKVEHDHFIKYFFRLNPNKVIENVFPDQTFKYLQRDEDGKLMIKESKVASTEAEADARHR